MVAVRTEQIAQLYAEYDLTEKATCTIITSPICRQAAQLPQRNSASVVQMPTRRGARPSHPLPRVPYGYTYAVFDKTYISFFSDSKKHDFVRYLNDSEKKRKKSVAKIMSAVMLTLLKIKKNSERFFFKIPPPQNDFLRFWSG